MNLDAALYMIRCCEHKAADVNDDSCYSVFYGGSLFSNFTDHPCITGEKKGVPLPEAWCKKLGFADGRCVSTAAGAYQFTVPTWKQYRTVEPHLSDFSKNNQDEACRRVLREIGAAALFEQNDFAGGLARASKKWASLPGSTAGQSVRSLGFAQLVYDEGLARSNRGIA